MGYNMVLEDLNNQFETTGKILEEWNNSTDNTLDQGGSSPKNDSALQAPFKFQKNQFSQVPVTYPDSLHS